MSEPETMTDHQVAMRIEEEGIGYAVLHYMGPEHIRSEETKKLWIAAEKALIALAEHLGVESY